MRKVLVDNMFLQKAAENNDISSKGIEYIELLCAIVLWDEVYFNDSEFSGWRKFHSPINNAVKPLPLQNEYETILRDESQLYLEKFDYDYRVEEYLRLSVNNNCDYLPCSERHECLIRSIERDPMRKISYLHRLKEMKFLDKEIADYYIETYSVYNFDDFQLDIPVLAKYIISNTPDGMAYTDYAMHMKYEGRLVEYRQYLDEVEDAFEKQDWRRLKKLVAVSKETAREVLGSDKKTGITVSAQMVPIPTMLVSPSLQIESDLPFRKTRIAFISDLAKFAIYDMKIF